MGTHSEELEAGERRPRKPPVWVVGLIAAAAGTEIWATWIGVGSLSGFPVLGIGRAVRIPTDWSLAVGMEAYAGFALWVWLTASSAAGRNSRNFAGASAIAALVLSLVVQVSYHLMLAADDRRAPGVLVGFVAGLPLIVLTLGAILIHLMREDAETARRTARKAHETDERTLLGRQLAGEREAHAAARAALSADLAGARQAHGTAAAVLSADRESAREDARKEAAVRAETERALAGLREELHAVRAERERAEDARQAAAREREDSVSAARREIDATRAQLDQARASAAMRPVIEAERDRARADASAAQAARDAAEAAHADAERAAARAAARAGLLERKLEEAQARGRTDAPAGDLSRLSPARAKEKAWEMLDADPSLTGEALAEPFGLKARWGQLRKQEWQASRDGGEGLRVVGEN